MTQSKVVVRSYETSERVKILMAEDEHEVFVFIL